MKEKISRLFRQTFGTPPESIARVAADGSQRIYHRLEGSPHGSVIGGVGPDREENRAFLSFSRTFREMGLSVPAIYAADPEQGVWLMEDLGDTTLFSRLQAARREAESEFPRELLPTYREVVEALPTFQVKGAGRIDFQVAYPRAAFDERSMRWDLNYFKYHFLKLGHVPFHEERLEEDFDRLVGFLSQADRSYFLYRDFQSRNVMLRDGAPWFIDYQGGRRGPVHYDVASLLYDAKARIPDPIREELLGRYLEELSRRIPVDGKEFRKLFRGFVVIRILQAMGAYGYRGFFEKKTRFLESVPHAASNLQGLMDSGLPLEIPELERVFGRIVENWGHTGAASTAEDLTVEVASFSYRNGYPSDDRGHGGGFVFDCRSLPNPGREPAHQASTGQDRDVIRFFEQTPQVEAFWEDVLPLVERHVRTFRERGFSDMSVAFGCTGGQHRSVYMAERLARHLTERFPSINVRVRHWARGSWPGDGGDGRWKR